MSNTPDARPVLCGEVLYDVFPDGRRIPGGAPLNVAWHLHGFGLDPLLISRVGNDRPGERLLALMAERGMDTSGIQIDPDHPTGEVQVRLGGDGEPGFHILPDRAWDHLDPADLPPLPAAGLLYSGTLARRAPATARVLETLQAGGLPGFLDLNLRTPWWSAETALQLMQTARWIKLNDDELRRLCPGERPLAERAEALLARSGADALLVTRGRRGAVLHRPGLRPLRVVPPPDVPVVDTVGAGDAFAAVVIAGLLLDWPTGETLHRAQQFAATVVGQPGAIPSSPDFHRAFCDAWALRTGTDKIR